MSTEVESHLPLTTVAFEILLAVAARECTGYEVMLAIEERTGGRLSPNPGTLYRAIDRLAGVGLLETADESGPSGKGRRTLGLSALGQDVLRAESDRLAAQVSAAHAAVGSPRESA